MARVKISFFIQSGLILFGHKKIHSGDVTHMIEHSQLGSELAAFVGVSQRFYLRFKKIFLEDFRQSLSFFCTLFFLVGLSSHCVVLESWQFD